MQIIKQILWPHLYQRQGVRCAYSAGTCKAASGLMVMKLASVNVPYMSTEHEASKLLKPADSAVMQVLV